MKTLTLLSSALALIAGGAFAEGELNIYNWSDYIAEDHC
jgi:spermidine/putrescine-binding protein